MQFSFFGEVILRKDPAIRLWCEKTSVFMMRRNVYRFNEMTRPQMHKIAMNSDRKTVVYSLGSE